MACKCPLCDNVIPQPSRVVLYPDANLVMWPTGYVKLTDAQFVIFQAIHNAYPQRISLERLAMRYYARCRHVDDPPGNDLIRVHVSLVRKKLREAGAPFHIPSLSEYGAGYVLRYVEQEKRA